MQYKYFECPLFSCKEPRLKLAALYRQNSVIDRSVVFNCWSHILVLCWCLISNLPLFISWFWLSFLQL